MTFFDIFFNFFLIIWLVFIKNFTLLSRSCGGSICWTRQQKYMSVVHQNSQTHGDSNDLDHRVCGHTLRLEEPIRSWHKERKRTAEDGASELDAGQHSHEFQYDRGVGRKLLPCQTEQYVDREVNSVQGETPQASHAPLKATACLPETPTHLNKNLFIVGCPVGERSNKQHTRFRWNASEATFDGRFHPRT